MKLSRLLPALSLAAACTLVPARAAESVVNPQVKKIVDEVSEDRIRAIIARLVAFGTRNLMSSQDDPERGIGAARKWIFQQFQSYSPRLQVRYDQWKVKKTGRMFRDVDLYNVIAVLPGKTNPEALVIVSGHYDSLNLGTPANGRQGGAGAAGGEQQSAVGERPTQANWEKIVDLPAPGANDDGSGTACVMELARVMSQYEFNKTLVFIAFAGEEEGLVGSTLEAAKMKKEGTIVEAVLNNDIIGTDVSGDGRTGNSAVSVYSDDQMDSPSQQLARYAHAVVPAYIPFMQVNALYMQDRLGRGGDHSPFQQEGFAAVRISTPNEILANEHHATDTLENMSVPYTARVVKVNGAIAASLALAPRTPDILTQPRARGANAGANGSLPGGGSDAGSPSFNPAGGPPRRLPMISRGSGYDAVLRWRTAGSDADIKGYAIVIRSTTAPFYEREIFVGKVTEFTLKGMSIDDARFGVKAIGNDGTGSLVAPYVYPARNKVVYETVQ
ncbi:MAG TPA: M28 family peptidase [Bryobacteraceae bacterium]|nr:M28 family peptidase [Bryobacteraceae bacterium]